MKTTSRRDFFRTSLRTGAAAGLGLAAANPLSAIEPLQRSGAPRLMLSLAAYSFRDFFVDGGPKRDSGPAKRIDLFQFIDFCAEHGCDGTELTSYYFPRDVDRDFLVKLKRHAFLRGIAISGTAVGNTFTVPAGPKRDQQIADVKRWIDHAAVMGAPHIRIFAGDAASGGSRDEARMLCIRAIEECCEHAGSKGIFLGLENHGGIVADPAGVLEIVRAVKSPWFGVNLDTGNFHTEDVYGDLAKCAPYAVNVQIKAEVHPQGKDVQAADLPRLVKILREANYQGYVALEYESKEDPWTAVPRLLKQLKGLLAAG
jgi:sugar phosphate isomerase/epimerase